MATQGILWAQVNESPRSQVAGENFVQVSLAAGPPPQSLKDVNGTE